MESPCISEIENHDLDVSVLFCTNCTWWKFDVALKHQVVMSIVESNDACEIVFDVGPFNLIDSQSAGHAVKTCAVSLLGHMVCRNIILFLLPIHLPSNANMIRIKICG